MLLNFEKKSVTTSSENPILITAARLLAPFIQVFALYVIFHGHYSPGGGFQGGAMLAASVLLLRLSLGSKIAQLNFKRVWGTPLGSIGAMIFAGTGLLTLFCGGRFLEYHFLPIPDLSRAELHSTGILFVEIGVGLAVMATLVAIYDDIVEGASED